MKCSCQHTTDKDYKSSLFKHVWTSLVTAIGALFFSSLSKRVLRLFNHALPRCRKSCTMWSRLRLRMDKDDNSFVICDVTEPHKSEWLTEWHILKAMWPQPTLLGFSISLQTFKYMLPRSERWFLFSCVSLDHWEIDRDLKMLTSFGI